MSFVLSRARARKLALRLSSHRRVRFLGIVLRGPRLLIEAASDVVFSDTPPVRYLRVFLALFGRIGRPLMKPPSLGSFAIYLFGPFTSAHLALHCFHPAPGATGGASDPVKIFLFALTFSITCIT